MANKWHLTPESGDTKGNNPYQLNRTTIDPSFRTASTAIPIKHLQGYSATGDITLKGVGATLQAIQAQNQAQAQAQTQTSVTAANTDSPSQNWGLIDRSNKASQLELLIRQQTGQSEWLSESYVTRNHLSNLTSITNSHYDRIMNEK